MIIHVPKVLTAEQVAQCRATIERASWVDGRVTAGHQSAKAKNNMQLPEGSPEHQMLGKMVLQALERNPLFFSAALPHTIFPPLFNRYDVGMSFGMHVDNSIRQSNITGARIRTDISATLFLSEPDDYDGGELTIEDSYGTHSVKLPAGDLILYPADSLHQVTPITRGARLASFFWIQSLIRDRAQRSILFELDAAIVQLSRELPNHAALVSLTGTYHNLLRQWAEV
jgi:PKHD-type hydroxylase